MYLLIFCAIWCGNPDESNHWAAIRMSDLDKLKRFATSILQNMKKDHVICLCMKIVHVPCETPSERIKRTNPIVNGSQTEIEYAYNNFQTVKVYK